MVRRRVLVLIVVLVAAFVPVVPAHAATLVVCAEGCAYDSIQAAVDAAAPGDVVRVLSGTYEERVVVTTSDLRIRANGVVIDGANVVDQPPLGVDPGEAPVAGAGIGLHVVGAPEAPVTGVNLNGMTVRGFERGIVLEHVESSRVVRTITTDNLDKGPCCAVDTTQADGIVLIGSSFNRLQRNTANANGHDGIFVRENSHSNVLVGNTTNENGVMFIGDDAPRGCGIQIGFGDNSNNVVRGNTVNDNNWGIQLGNAGDLFENKIESNLIHGNTRAGIALFDIAHDNVIRNNDATGNALSGIDPSGPYDLWDEGVLDNTWTNNEGTSNF